MFEPDSISDVWAEVVQRTTKFLRSVVLGDVAPDPTRTIPLVDKHTSLALLLELAVQKGSLHEILDAVLLLMHIWQREHQRHDNRAYAGESSAPLIPFLRRFDEIQPTKEPIEGESFFRCFLLRKVE